MTHALMDSDWGLPARTATAASKPAGRKEAGDSNAGRTGLS